MSKDKAGNLLENSPFDDDLQTLLAARPARAGASKLTLALGGGVLLVAGLLLGIQAQKTFGSKSPTPAISLPEARANGTGGGGLGGGGFGGGRRGADGSAGAGRLAGAGGAATFGTVRQVDGDKIHIQTMGGGEVTVRISDDTKVQVTRPGKAEDLKPGSTVVVSGARGADGAVDATSVSESSAFGGRRTQ